MIKNNKSLNKVCKGAEEVRLYNLLWSIYLSCIGLFKGYSVCTKNWRQCRMLPEQASTADVISKSNHIPRIFFINFLCVIIGPRVIYLFVCFLLWLAEHLFTVLYSFSCWLMTVTCEVTHDFQCSMEACFFAFLTKPVDTLSPGDRHD